jgi:hypothetical protein
MNADNATTMKISWILHTTIRMIYTGLRGGQIYFRSEINLDGKIYGR